MIFASIEHLAIRLNQHLKSKFELNEDIVIVSNLAENSGGIEANTDNKIVIFLASLEKDTMPQRQSQSQYSPNGRSLITNKPLYLNLSIVLAANFTGANYQESLKFISHVILFFQQNPVFDHHNSPDLDSKIEKLILDIENIPRQDLNSLWGMFGAKYLPSVVYKVRMVTMASDAIHGQVGVLQQPSLDITKSDR